MVPDKPGATVWAVLDYCDPECNSAGASVVALFDSEQTARQFANARDYPSVRVMSVYHAMKRYD
jgi:hypothetical protein